MNSVVQNKRSINFSANWKIKTCTSPCGTIVNHGSSTTCYPSSAISCGTTCQSETRTCYDGYWMNGNTKQGFTQTYTRTSCLRKATSCNSTTYPLTTSSISNGTTEPCGYYDVSNNVCSSKQYRYKITSCNPGYTLNESKTACVQIYCPQQGACGRAAHGFTCTTYNRCSSTAIQSTCNLGSWSTKPGSYEYANQGCSSCPASNGCPTTTNHNGQCTTYSTTSSSNCSSYKRISTCTDGHRDNSPLAFSSCTTYVPPTPDPTPTPNNECDQYSPGSVGCTQLYNERNSEKCKQNWDHDTTCNNVALIWGKCCN